MGTLVERAAAFLAGDGRNVVRRNLRAQGLAASLHDDVVQEVLVDLLILADRGLEPDNLEAFVSTLVHRQTVDILRGHRRRPEGHLIPSAPAGDESLEPFDLIDRADGPDAEVITADELARLGAIVDDLRARLAARLDRHPTRAAGALAVLAIVHGDATPAEDCPSPVGGVSQHEATTWAGVFYGGADRCFPTETDPEDAAMRQRRSRALRHLRAALQDAAADLGAILEVDDA